MPEQIADISQVGASEATATTLNELVELGHIGELSDGYRLGIAVALSFGRMPRTVARRGRKTMLAVSGLDPEGAIRASIREIYPDSAAAPYRAAEDLAEQGVEILRSCMEGDAISFADLMARLQDANEVVPTGEASAGSAE